MKKQSNIYALIYSVGLVLVVGVVLSLIYQSLRPQQEENEANDMKSQILKAALISGEGKDIPTRQYSEPRRGRRLRRVPEHER